MLGFALNTAWAQGHAASRIRDTPTPGDTRFYPENEIEPPAFKDQRAIFGRPRYKNAAEQLLHAQTLEAQKKNRSALRAYDALVHEWPDAPEAAQAQLQVGVLYKNNGNIERAFKELQYYIEAYATSLASSSVTNSTYLQVVTHQYELAQSHLASLHQNSWFSRPNGALVAAMFKQVVLNAPEWDQAAHCLLLAGNAFSADKKWLEAIEVYNKIHSAYPGNHEVRLSASYKTAIARTKISDQYPNDERSLVQALDAYSRFNQLHRKHFQSDESKALEQIEKLSQRYAKLCFERAEFYDRIRKDPKAAHIAYQQFLKQCPGAEQVPWVKNRIQELEAQIQSPES